MLAISEFPFFLKIIVNYSTIVVKALVILAGRHGMEDSQMILYGLCCVYVLGGADFAQPIPQTLPLIREIRQVAFLRRLIVILLKVRHQAAETNYLTTEAAATRQLCPG